MTTYVIFDADTLKDIATLSSTEEFDLWMEQHEFDYGLVSLDEDPDGEYDFSVVVAPFDFMQDISDEEDSEEEEDPSADDVDEELLAQIIDKTNRVYFCADPWADKTYNGHSMGQIDGIIVDPKTVKHTTKHRMFGEPYVEVQYEATITFKDGRWTHLRLAPQVCPGDFKKSGMKWARFQEDNVITNIDGMTVYSIHL